ncbi:MAG: hypothetical protein JNK82_00525 [Myxococcaceae bacterium]|nr:hypothetical protein [Myxococcaceae bacterium]
MTAGASLAARRAMTKPNAVVARPLPRLPPAPPEGPLRAADSPRPVGHSEQSRFEGVSKQARAPSAASAAAVHRERINQLLADGSPVMRSLNPRRSAVNCPATASAVDEYLRTGTVNPAVSGGPRSTFAFAQRWQAAGNLQQVLRRDGSHVVLRGTRSEDYANLQGITREHYFVAVNRGGRLYAVDAYNHTTAPLNEYLQCDQFQTIERYRGPFQTTHVPGPLLGR